MSAYDPCINPHNFPCYSEADRQYLVERHRDEIRSLRDHFERKLVDREYRSTCLYDYPRRPYDYRYSFINGDWGFSPPAFLISQKEVSLPVATKTHIIIGTSGAAAHPTAHTTLADAEKEATRLAKKTPGEEFTIYTTTKSFKVEDKPVTVKTFI
jgi:hypothetical protein